MVSVVQFLHTAAVVAADAVAAASVGMPEPAAAATSDGTTRLLKIDGCRGYQSGVWLRVPWQMAVLRAGGLRSCMAVCRRYVPS